MLILLLLEPAFFCQKLKLIVSAIYYCMHLCQLYEEEKLKNDRSSVQMDKLRAELSEAKADLERTLLSIRDSGALQSHLESRVCIKCI
jgi:hypothetical protein